jgi:WD40 repeat protein
MAQSVLGCCPRERTPSEGRTCPCTKPAPKVATAGADSSVPTGAASNGARAAVTSLAFGPLPAQLAAGSLDGGVYLWSLASQTILRRLEAGRPVLAVVVAAKKRLLVAALEDGGLVAWDTGKWTPRWRTPASRGGGRNRGMSLSRDEEVLATVDDAGVLRLFAPATGVLTEERKVCTKALAGVELTIAGEVAVACGREVLIRSRGGKAPGRKLSFEWQVLAFAFSPDGGRLAVAQGDEGIVVVELLPTEHRTTLRSPSRMRTIVFSGDGTLLAAVGGEGGESIALHDIAKTKVLHLSLESNGARPLAVAFSPDSRILVSASDGGILRVLPRELFEPALAAAKHPGAEGER